MGENVTEGWHTLADRLHWAIGRRPSRGRQRGLRLFQRDMGEHARDVQGTSLSAIQGYLRSDVEPSLSFVQHAARLLAVREAWLAWGTGAPTEEEEAGRRESPEAALFRISTAVHEALGVPTRIPAGIPLLGHPEGLPEEQLPALHVSVPVQKASSSHAAPLLSAAVQSSAASLQDSEQSSSPSPAPPLGHGSPE